jgi:uncharacterized protein
MDLSLSDEEKKILLFTARESVKAAFERKALETPSRTPSLSLPCGAFVTIKKNGNLRGCIGSMVGRAPLVDTVRDMAYQAAFEDPRFEAMEREEVEMVDFEISVLSPLQPVKDLSEIVVGVHGLYMIGKGRSGVLLPQVATEWGWDKETFLKQTCRKAGLPVEAYKDPDVTMYKFSAIVFGEKD